MNQSYVGDVVNFKAYSESYKLKIRINNERENWQIHKDVHEPVINRELFEEIQESFGDTPSIENQNAFPKICLQDF